MPEVEPAIAHIGCPYDDCLTVLNVVIPVTVSLQHVSPRQQVLTAQVEHEQVDVQPVWDHVLAVHGPQIS